MSEKYKWTKRSEEIPGKLSHMKQERLDELLSSHREEISQLQNKEFAMKKTGNRTGQKAKKKQLKEEISQLSAKFKERDREELASPGCSCSNSNANDNLDSSVNPSQSVKRREKRAQQEAAREQRIREEQRNIISDRMVENERLERKLKPLGLRVNEIKPDGHCLYRAVEDQLALLSGGSSPYTYQELREMVASYMRKHALDFLPFFLSENGDSDDSPRESFESYCREAESTAAWGGQLELGALTHCLKKQIMIFSGSFPDVEMGKEYKSNGGIGSSDSSIMLSYHRHAFGLGEHYNSVVPSYKSTG